MNRPGLEPGSTSAQISAPTGPPPAIPDHELLRLVGRGAYGEVWLARNIMGEYRAVKIVYRRSFDHDRPYQREFEGIKKFEPVSRTHESQVDILHVGKNEQEGYFYYVMELADDQVAGQKIDPDCYRPQTLKSRLYQEQRLAPAECVKLGLALTTALTHLHQNGLVHRDIKPSNIIFINRQPKLADIGLVSSFDATLSYVGTLGFSPPEGPGSVAADVYSLGKVLYEAVTGRDRQEFPELPTDLSGPQAEQTAFVELNEIILKACDGNPRHRYQTAEAMHADLALLESGQSVARLHSTERRLAKVKRWGLAASAATFLLASGSIYQVHEARIVKKLAAQNLDLARQSERAATENRNQLIRLQVANGVRKIEEGDFSASLPWLAEALANSKGDPQQEAGHRLLLRSVLDHCPKLIRLFLLESPAYGCGFSPDGRILICNRGSEVLTLDVGTGDPLFKLSVSNAVCSGHVFSSDGRRLVVRWGDVVKVFDSTDGRLLDFPEEALRSKEKLWSCDGRMILVRTGELSVQVLDLDSGKALSPPIFTSSRVINGWLSEDGQYVTLCSDEPEHGDDNARKEARRNHLQSWEVATGHPLGPAIVVNPQSSGQLSREGKRLFVQQGPGPDPPRLQVFATETGAEMQAAPGWDNVPLVKWPWAVTFPADGTRLWNLETDQSLTLKNAGWVRDFALSPDGLLLATAGDDGTVRVWNSVTGTLMFSPLRHSRWAFGVGFSADSRLLATCSADYTLRVWDLASVRKPEFALREGSGITYATFSPDGQKIVTLAYPLSVWDAHSGKSLAPPSYDHGPRTDLRFSSDGQQFVTFERLFSQPWVVSDAYLWRMPEGRHLPTFLDLAHDKFVCGASFSPDGKRMVTAEGSLSDGATNGSARVWDTTTGKVLLILKHDGDVTSAQFSPNGHQIATAGAGSVKIWDAGDGKCLGELKPDHRWYQTVVFSPDGRNIATGSRDQTVRVWEAGTLAPVTPPLFHGGNPLFAKFSPDGRLLLSWGISAEVRVWDIEKGALRLAPLSCSGGFPDAEFSHDGRLIVACDDGGTTRAWSVATGGPVTVPLRNSGPRRQDYHNTVYTAKFSPSGDRILTAGEDKTARVWELQSCNYSLKDLTALAQLLSGQQLDGTGALMPLSGQEIRERFEKLRSSSLDEFRDSTVHERAVWHEQMSDQAWLVRSWSSVVWHVDHALKLDPGLEQTPTFDEVFSRRGRAYAELGQWAEAAADFGRAVQLCPEKFPHRNDQICALAAAGATAPYQVACAAALNDFKRAWAMDSVPDVPGEDPPNAALRRNLGRACALAPNIETNVDRGLAIFKTLMPPNRPSVLGFWQSMLLSRSGRCQQALEVLRYTLTRDPAVEWSIEAPSPFLELLIEALVYARAGRTAEARHMLAEATASWHDEQAKVLRSAPGFQAEAAACRLSFWTDQAAYVALRQEVETILGTPTSGSKVIGTAGQTSP